MSTNCPACGERLRPRDGERLAEYRRRTYCNQDCYHADSGRRATEQQAERELAETNPNPHPAVDFDPGHILRVAGNAAPQVPVSLLADVVRAVEPLIASNTRRLLLAQVATKFRVTQETR